jgi:oxygen-dependent protoporphyrinogen oxidase
MEAVEQKNLVIVGGGISGCAALHYLNREYRGRAGVNITLLEKSGRPGGTISTRHEAGCFFEEGPNGFLDSKPRTLEFIAELGLEDELARADGATRTRYICQDHALHILPSGPGDFLRFPLLSPGQKLRALAELVVGKGKKSGETVGAFGRRRLGRRFTEVFIDSMVSGIYAGDPDDLLLKAAFPRIAELEERFGSLLRAQIALAKAGKAGGQAGSPRGRLTSFRKGMQSVTARVAELYPEQIRTDCPVEGITFKDSRYQVKTPEKTYAADELFLCVPAYAAAGLTAPLDQALSRSLEKIPYAPVAVIGLVYPKGQLPAGLAKGFGYLIPSTEKSEILGVLFEHDLFPGRTSPEKALFRIMAGGVRHPVLLDLGADNIVDLARKELALTLKIKAEPEHVFFKLWPRGIPQYNRAGVTALAEANRALSRFPGLRLLANYRGGISFNDCVENAFWTAKESVLPHCRNSCGGK